MAKKTKKAPVPKSVESLRHDDASRKNIPTAEYQSVMHLEDQDPIRVAYERRNRDLDPQLVWRGKDVQDWSDLVVQAPPLYIQEKIHPKVLVDDLRQRTQAQQPDAPQMDLFGDFNGLPSEDAKTEFYQHDANWTNRMILGDSLQVMASLAEREGLRGKVQCIYLDPPYGIKFNSNFQWSTTSRDVKDGKADHITREPEQVKAFRDTWRDGIHSYLTYLRDRLVVARDLLTDSGSIFVQIGDENVHRVRALMDEVFGDENLISLISVQKTSSFPSSTLANVSDYLCWYAKNSESLKARPLFDVQPFELGSGNARWLELNNFSYRGVTAKEKRGKEDIPDDAKPYKPSDMMSQGQASKPQPFNYRGIKIDPKEKKSHWKANYPTGMDRIMYANRIHVAAQSFQYKRFHTDWPYMSRGNIWTDTGTGNFTDDKVYVVQTNTKVVERCILMATSPGDLVLDPTCGSGTTAYVAEHWGRRWITIDTSRVALALARARIMGARYPYYLLADSKDGQQKEAEITQTAPKQTPITGNIRQGFVYERVPHIMLKDIANNAEIDVIWEQFQEKLEPLREQLNKLLETSWEEWKIPREAEDDWPDEAKATHEQWWKQRIARQKEIDASIAAKADSEYLYDKPYEDKKKVRVAGPFTVESISPHRTLAMDENDELLDGLAEDKAGYGQEQSFTEMILENLKTAGVQQAHKENKINFSSLTPWPGRYVGAEGKYSEGTDENAPEKRAAIFIGPEFGTVPRPDLVAAAREAGDAGFDVLIACAFNYDAHSSEFEKLGRIPVLKARMNADLHMAGDLKNTGKGNLFVIFGEPDIDVLEADSD
ncbi:MAG: site-specific DNA-methyltransferase, partial [Tunicatimonas sp.]